MASRMQSKTWLIPAGIAILQIGIGEASGAEVKDVAFPGSGGLQLQGTLVTPSCGTRGCPALLLLPGSGPTDRDGNQKPYLTTDLLKEIADRLAIENVATLRFDKRAVAAYANRWPKDINAREDFFSWESFVEDAAAAFRFLSSQSGIDPKRVGILGHSEGSIIALAVATEKPAGAAVKCLVLAGMPGRKLADVVEEQLRDHLPQSGMPKEEVEKLLAKNAEIIKAAIDRAEIPDDVPDILKPLYPKGLGKYLQKYLPMNPAELAGKYAGPVLLLQGDADAQTNVKLDTPPLKAALEARKAGSVEAFIVVGASHNLKRISNPLDPGISGPVVPDVLNRTVRWLKENL